MTLTELDGNGWLKPESGKLGIEWDTEENMLKVRDRVRLLMKGCGCKSGCRTLRCGCRRKGKACGPGCRCTNCENQGEDSKDNTVVETERGCVIDTGMELDDIMKSVFGFNHEEEESDTSCETSDDSVDESLI